MDKRRLFFPTILLAIILPTIFLSSFHHHEAFSDGDCTNCAAHLPHQHINGSHGTDCCLICSFLTILWVNSEETTGPALQENSCGIFLSPAFHACGPYAVCHSTRAPPTVFC